jgi:2'-hydroxyisoflavone reductase
MSSIRKQFIMLSTFGIVLSISFICATKSLAADLESSAGKSEKAAKPLRILILGGTGFTGPFQVRYALSRGHKVTVFNRGKTHPGELPEGVEQLIGDRNGKLDALKGRKWDVVIDNPTSAPVWVRDVGQILRGNADRYIFISTISVYADNSKPDMDESAALAKYAGVDAMKETRDTLIASKFALYGPLKALSEKEAEKWFPGKTLIIRPGLIVGPGDESDRFTYWPVRIDRGGEVLAPGEPNDPVQFIDARDLAEWTVRMAEQGETGIYNATGPASQIGIGKMLNEIKSALNSNATFTWVNADFLEKQKVAAWSDMPVWVAPRGEDAGAARVSIKRALAKDLTFRPLAETARDTRTWFKSQPAERQAKLKGGITREREAEVLTAWHKEAK